MVWKTTSSRVGIDISSEALTDKDSLVAQTGSLVEKAEMLLLGVCSDTSSNCQKSVVQKGGLKSFKHARSLVPRQETLPSAFISQINYELNIIVRYSSCNFKGISMKS